MDMVHGVIASIVGLLYYVNNSYFALSRLEPNDIVDTASRFESLVCWSEVTHKFGRLLSN